MDDGTTRIGSRRWGMTYTGEAMAEIERLRAEVARLTELRARGCECSDEDACRFMRERDEARAQIRRMQRTLRDACEEAGDVSCDECYVAADCAALPTDGGE